MLSVEFNNYWTAYSVISESVEKACEHFFEHCKKYKCPQITNYLYFKYEKEENLLKIYYKNTAHWYYDNDKIMESVYQVTIEKNLEGKIFIEELI